MKDDHPPILESGLLKRHTQGIHVFWESQRNSSRTSFWQGNSQDRHLVACYWRCAWQDEASRNSTRVTLSSNGRLINMYKEAECEALKNAEAWRVWGGSE